MNVLVATDGSKYGRWGLDWIARLPLMTLPRVTVLHVLEISEYRSAFYSQREIQRVEARTAKILKEATQRLAVLKLKGAVRKAQGAVASVILKAAPKRDGLLVVGSRGLDALDRFLFGSVSTNLIHHATCPVLVVKGEAAPLQRIVLAIDGSPGSAKALEFVLTKFQPNRPPGKGVQAPIHVSVVHVMPFMKYPELKEAGRSLVEQSVRKLVKVGFTAEPLCQIGNCAEEIMKGAERRDADLIVMGAKGMAAIGRIFLGSVSTRVVQHANCAVLVVR
ncbi:MAG: universal stress protein [Nitrospiraceae bacterium]